MPSSDWEVSSKKFYVVIYHFVIYNVVIYQFKCPWTMLESVNVMFKTAAGWKNICTIRKRV